MSHGSVPITVFDFYRDMKEKQQKTLEVVDIIVDRCYQRIRRAMQVRAYEIFFEIPEFVYGYPCYELRYVMAHVISKLRKNGYAVEYKHPNTIRVSWKISDLVKNRGFDAIRESQVKALHANTLQLTTPTPITLTQAGLSNLHVFAAQPIKERPAYLERHENILTALERGQRLQDTLTPISTSSTSAAATATTAATTAISQAPPFQIKKATVTRYKPTGKVVLHI
jgi:hypothetical protein